MDARTLLLSMIWISILTPAVMAEDVRYLEKNGVTYREVKRRVQRPVVETRVEQREQTVYRHRYVTETRPSTRTVYTPVTEYRWEGRWHGVLNPFAPAYVGYHLVPRTHWETQNQEVQNTVTRRELVPEKRVVSVPVTQRRMVEEEVITRTAVRTPSTGRGRTSVARSTNVGGISRLENDPPRKSSNWTSKSTVVR